MTQRDCKVGDVIRWLGGSDRELEAWLIKADGEVFIAQVLKSAVNLLRAHTHPQTRIWSPNTRKDMWEFTYDDFEQFVIETREKAAKRAARKRANNRA